MNCNYLKQEGIVVALNDKEASVEINICSGCHASGSCPNGSDKKRIVTAITNEKIKLGSKVLVAIKPSFGFTSVFYCYLLPFLIMIISMLLTFFIFKSEGIAVVLALLSLPLYYTALYFFYKIKGYNQNFFIEIIEP